VRERYLQLPDDLPGRVARKAIEVAGSEDTPYDQAVAVERYLRTFPSDFDVPAPPAGRDAIDYFLFETQRGYFDYHASAMAVLLRALGVPVRVATGYVVDPLQRDGLTDSFQLTQKQAFAWPEVYFPGIGWVEFSPTPSQPLIQRPGLAPEPPSSQPGEPGGAPAEPDLGIEPPAGPAPASDEPGSDAAGSRVWPVLLAMVVVGGAVALLAGGLRFAWEYPLRGMPPPSRVWEKTRRLARLAKISPAPAETPREFAARLRRDVPGADGAGYLAARYEDARFGHKTLSEDQADRLEAAWAATRGSLLRRALRMRARRG
jgi:transglutaminase-like putative cysteine protease